MKNFNINEFCYVAAFMTLVLIFSSSCKKDAPENSNAPNYVGTWIYTGPISEEEFGDLLFKDIMTLSANSFTDLMQVQLSTDSWVDFFYLKGSMSVKANIMSFTVAEIGFTSLDELTEFPTGVMTSYNTGSTEFNELLSDLGHSNKTFISEFSVSGNQLTLMTDKNEDGDYLDLGETTVYTKQ